MTQFFDWFDQLLATNAGTFGAMLALLLMLAIIGAIAELDA